MTHHMSAVIVTLGNIIIPCDHDELATTVMQILCLDLRDLATIISLGASLLIMFVSMTLRNGKARETGLVMVAIENGLVAVARTELIFGSAPEVYEPVGAVALPSIRGDVAFENVPVSAMVKPL